MHYICIINKKRERELKRTGDFGHFSERARRLIAEECVIPDVTLMEKLKFTPPSWKIWKPKLIEKFLLEKYSAKIKETGEKVQYRIRYIKTSKTWNVLVDDCISIKSFSHFLIHFN